MVVMTVSFAKGLRSDMSTDEDAMLIRTAPCASELFAPRPNAQSCGIVITFSLAWVTATNAAALGCEARQLLARTLAPLLCLPFERDLFEVGPCVIGRSSRLDLESRHRLNCGDVALIHVEGRRVGGERFVRPAGVLQGQRQVHPRLGQPRHQS